MRYSLKNYNPKTLEYGYKGDSGSMSNSILFTENESFTMANSQPVVGERMQVGTPFARTFSNQDWWMTTEVAEILESYEDEDSFNVKFKTVNGSYYHWKEYK